MFVDHGAPITDEQQTFLVRSLSRPQQLDRRMLAWIGSGLAGVSMTIFAAGTNSPGSSPGDMLLLDSMGRVVAVPTNQVPAALQPKTSAGMGHQIPTPAAGSSMTPEVLGRIRANANGFQFLAATPPRLMPYLANLDEKGNTALRPGPLFNLTGLDWLVQGGKYWLSEYGFRYSLQQTFTDVSMTDVMKGENNLGYHTTDLKAKWALFDAPEAGTAGWVTSEIVAKNSFEATGKTQSAKSNLGTLTDPTGIWSSVNGLRVPELAWQQSVCDGELVVVAGMVSERNYIDGNAYASSGRGEFINSALIHSQVLPLPQYNFGLNLQWQPAPEWYGIIGSSLGAGNPGQTPWTDFTTKVWSLPAEIGYAPHDLFNLGPGVYRIQPFAAGAEGATGGGLCFDLQQQLGPHSPVGWYGRFGFGDSKVSAGASTQVATGFVMQGPFKHLLLQRTSNDLLGIGFAWSQPSATSKTVYHDDEYVLETVYALQLTPTIKFQPDLQVVWNPAFNRDAGPALVAQFQLVMSW
jgi:porin